jgi:hypothetical protein
MKKDNTNMNPVRGTSEAFKQKKLETHILFTIRLY